MSATHSWLMPAASEVPAQIRIHPQTMVGECGPRTANALLYKKILFSQKRKQRVSADIDTIVTFEDMLQFPASGSWQILTYL